PPRFSLAVSDFQYVVTFAVMLAVTLIIASLVANVRAQTRVAGARERRTALLYGMSRELTATRELEDLARVAVKHVAETLPAVQWYCCLTRTDVCTTRAARRCPDPC